MVSRKSRYLAIGLLLGFSTATPLPLVSRPALAEGSALLEQLKAEGEGVKEAIHARDWESAWGGVKAYLGLPIPQKNVWTFPAGRSTPRA